METDVTANEAVVHITQKLGAIDRDVLVSLLSARFGEHSSWKAITWAVVYGKVQQLSHDGQVVLLPYKREASM